MPPLNEAMHGQNKYVPKHHPTEPSCYTLDTGVTIQWTRLLDWNTGLDYWTDIFLIFAHSMVGFMESCQ